MAGLFGGGSPDPPKPPPPPPPPKKDDSDEKRLAQQRRDLEAKRAGRKSLVIPNRNPGIAGVKGSGLRINRS